MSLYCRRVLIPFASLLVGLMLLSFAGVALPATQVQEQPVKYSKVRVYITSKDDILSLARAGIGIDHIEYRVNYFDTVLNNRELAVLQRTGKRYRILVDDVVAEYRKRPIMSPGESQALLEQQRKQYNAPWGFHFGSMGGYYTFAEVIADLDDMRALYPNLITARQSIGLSIEGRDLWVVKISDNPDIDENEVEILYTGLHHAREPQSMATLMYFMWYLLENYGTDPTVTNLVDNRELYFVPVVNPDGYFYNEQTDPNGGGMWRKNRRDNGDPYFGVDLNRNYAYAWGYDDSGSSPYTWSETYRGTAGFSEPETQAMHDFAISRQFYSANNYHSYGDYVIFPYGYVPNLDTPDQATFVAWADNMTQFNNYIYGHANQTVGYVVNGEANDWFYGEQIEKGKVFAFTTEIGSWFWPSQSEIIPLAQENLYPNLFLASTGGTCLLITISPSTLPNAILGAAYNQTLTGIGGTAPYTFALTGGALPAGLALNPATGVISGTPTTVETANFQITATDSLGCAGSETYTIAVVCPTITLTPTTLPNGQTGVPYSQTITASGGAAPYSFAVTSGVLPAGLSLDPVTGVISGTPTTVETANFQVTATDSQGCVGSRTYTIRIMCPTITVAPATLPNGQTGVPYNQTITASGGTAPYSFAVTSGTLPAGLALDSATGVISGTPTTAETANFQITATDFFGCAKSKNYTIGIACPAIALAPVTLPNSQAGVPYDQTITASGGTAPYTFDLTSGTLPAGLTLDPATGNISGTPSLEGSFSFTITATDSMGCPGSQPYVIDIAGLCDRFDDGVMPTDWTYLKPAWDETGGYLNAVPAGRKAIAIATPAFPDCQTCNIQAGIRFAGGADTRIWLLTHYNDKSNTMELLLKEATNKVVLKQRVNGSILKKAKATFTIDINADYDVGLAFDGTEFVVTIDGAPVIHLTPAGSPPTGSVGFQIKNGTGSFDYLCVN